MDRQLGPFRLLIKLEIIFFGGNCLRFSICGYLQPCTTASIRSVAPIVTVSEEDLNSQEFEIEKVSAVKVGMMHGRKESQLHFLVHFADQYKRSHMCGIVCLMSNNGLPLCKIVWIRLCSCNLLSQMSICSMRLNSRG